MEKPNFLPDSPSFVDLCTLHQHAMRYYRLWIYACNTVLAIATLVFTIFAVSVLVDPRLTLLSGVELYQPTFIYAYVALILQCGVLQAIGCLGALRLNQRLLNTYWTLLLLLMIGDIVVGLVWAIRLDRIKSSLRPGLRQRLSLSYGLDPQFTQVWDWVQTHEICCGIDSPDDFHFNESIGHIYEGQSAAGGGNDNIVPTDPHPITFLPLVRRLPSTCCTFTKRDSNEVGKLQEDSDGHPLGILSMSNFPRHHHSAGGIGSRDYISSEVNKRHSHQHSQLSFQSFQSTSKRRSPRASQLLSSDDLLPSSAAFLRTRPKLLPPTSTSMTKTEKINLQNQSSKGNGNGRWRSRTAPPLTRHPQPSSTDPVMMMRSDEVQNICVLPPHLLLNQNPTESSFENFDENLQFSRQTSSPSPTTSSEVPTPPGYSHRIVNQYHIHLHRHGCVDKILVWVNHVTDVLFVLGFCIIVFLKGCFLAILRYEIKEMIQKIRLLNGDESVRNAAMNELIGLTAIYDTSGSQDELGLEEVTCEALELGHMSPPVPPDPTPSSVPPKIFQLSTRHQHNALGPTTSNSISDAAGTPAETGKPAKKGYPPFGNYLNSNNMMYRLQRQMSQQAQQDDTEEDAESCAALLQRRSQSASGSGGSGSAGSSEKRNSTTSRRINTVAIPIPRNGNNNNMTHTTTTTALVGATSVTGSAPLTSASAAKVLSS